MLSFVGWALAKAVMDTSRVNAGRRLARVGLLRPRVPPPNGLEMSRPAKTPSEYRTAVAGSAPASG